jgi:hypothetical protein
MKRLKLILVSYSEKMFQQLTKSSKLMATARAKFVLFTIGLATAIGSAITSIIILSTSMLGGRSVVYEPNVVIAFVETIFLTISVGTCFIASEVYYEYLEMKDHLTQKA